jgi:hypothetical protein
MKTKAFLALSISLSSILAGHCQGTFVYDQQSSTNEVYTGFFPYIQSNEPIGQSFVPALASVGFIRLFISDSSFPVGSPSTVSVNLLADSITGTVLGATSPLDLPGGYFGYTNFFFPTPVSITPGTTYYFQLVANSADDWGTLFVPVLGFNGTGYLNGAPYGSGISQLWFREGIVVPEPSFTLLLLTGGSLLHLHRNKSKRQSQ